MSALGLFLVILFAVMLAPLALDLLFAVVMLPVVVVSDLTDKWIHGKGEE